MKRLDCALLILTLLLWGNQPAMSGANEMREGKDFVRLRAPVPVESADKIELIEFFSYACPHCRDFAREVLAWRRTLPADVEFRRVPVLFQEQWLTAAKAYYTLEALGMQEDVSLDVSLHAQGPLLKDNVFFDLAALRGLDRIKVSELYNSASIRCRVNHAKVLAQKYNVQVVPMVVVDGKFVTSVEQTGTRARLLAVLNELITMARRERSLIGPPNGHGSLTPRC